MPSPYLPHPPCPRASRRGLVRQGFTLIELMIAVAVLAIITVVAMPMFLDSVRASRRADAAAGITQVMQAQERWRANNAQYYQGALSGLPGAPSNSLSASGYYTLSIVAGSANAQGYQLQAAAVTGGPQASDSLCQVMSVTVAGGSPPSYRSVSGAGVQNGTPDPCWAR